MPDLKNNETGLSLATLVSNGQFYGGQDVRFDSICREANECQPGDLFVAIDGDCDGHDFAFDAVARGAKAVVVERLLPLSVPQLIVDDTREAFGHLCHALSGSPTDRLCTIGVTGTYGKTTTELLMVGILEAAGQATGVLGSLGYCDGIKAELRARTTPRSAEMMSWLGRIRDNGCSHAVIEASSEALAKRELSGVKLDVAAFTNIRREHLDIHHTIVNYRHAKERMLSLLKPNGVAVMNADDPACVQILSKLNCPVMTYSMKHDAEVTATIFEQHQSEQTFLLHAGNDSVPVRTQMIGKHHIYNCLAAACMGLVLGIDLPTIAKGLESVSEIPSRLERLECGQPFGVFVDGSTSPESLATGLTTLRSVTSGRLICLASPQSELSSVERARLGSLMERFSDECVLTNDVELDASGNYEMSDKSDGLHDMLDGFDRPAQARLLPNRAKAICWALGEAQEGDTVLLAGSPRDICQGRNEKARFFDRDVAEYWLQTIGSDKASPWAPA